MGHNVLRLAASLVAAFALAAPASAAIHQIDITVDAVRWHQVSGTDLPFGINADDVFTAQLQLDDTLLGPQRQISSPDLGTAWYDTWAITDLTFTAGSKVWTLSDLADTSFAAVNGEALFFLHLRLDGPPLQSSLGWATGGGSLTLEDGPNLAYCNFCTGYEQYVDGVLIAKGVPTRRDPSPIPEPSTWALMILGFGLAGSALRLTRRARRSRPV